MANWFHRFLNPHCPDCMLEIQDKTICRSCETLRTEVARLTQDNERLLNVLLDKNIPNKVTSEVPMMIRPPVNVPWNVKRQILEREDRERAKLMKEAPKPVDVNELEKELNIAEENRNAIHGGDAQVQTR